MCERWVGLGTSGPNHSYVGLSGGVRHPAAPGPAATQHAPVQHAPVLQGPELSRRDGGAACTQTEAGPLHYAAARGRTEAVKALAEAGGSVNAATKARGPRRSRASLDLRTCACTCMCECTYLIPGVKGVGSFQTLNGRTGRGGRGGGYREGQRAHTPARRRHRLGRECN